MNNRSLPFLIFSACCLLLIGVPDRTWAQVFIYSPTVGNIPNDTSYSIGPDDAFPDGATVELNQDNNDPSIYLDIPNCGVGLGGGSLHMAVNDYFSGASLDDGDGNYWDDYNGTMDYYELCERFANGQPASFDVTINLSYTDEDSDSVSSSFEVYFIGPDSLNDPDWDCNSWPVSGDEDDFSAEDSLISSLTDVFTGDDGYDATVLAGLSANETTAFGAYVFFHDGDQEFLNDLVGNGVLSFGDGLVQQAYSVANNDDQGRYAFFEMVYGGVDWSDLSSSDAAALYDWAMSTGYFSGDDSNWGSIIYDLLGDGRLSLDELDATAYNALTDYVQIQGSGDGQVVYNGLLYGVLNWNSLTTAQFDYLQSWADTEYSDAYFDDLESYFEDYTPPVPPDLADWVLTQDEFNGEAVYYGLTYGILLYGDLDDGQESALLDYTGWDEDTANDYFDCYTPLSLPDESYLPNFTFRSWVDNAEFEFDDDGNPVEAGNLVITGTFYVGPSDGNPMDFIVSPDGPDELPDGAILINAYIDGDDVYDISVDNAVDNYYYYHGSGEFTTFGYNYYDGGTWYMNDDYTVWIYGGTYNGLENWYAYLDPTDEASDGVNNIYYGDTLIGQFTVTAQPTIAVEVYNNNADVYQDYTPYVTEVAGSENSYISAWPGEDVTIWLEWDYGATDLSVATPADATLIDDDLSYTDGDGNDWSGWEFEFSDSVANQQDQVNVTESSGGSYYFDDYTSLYAEGWGSLPNGG